MPTTTDPDVILTEKILPGKDEKCFQNTAEPKRVIEHVVGFDGFLPRPSPHPSPPE